MKRYISFTKRAALKSAVIIKNDGVLELGKRAGKYAYYKAYPERKKREMKDILFINGCALPHPERYRVQHQMEQLEASGITSDSVFYDQLDRHQLSHYRGFVFFRCPVTSEVEAFIAEAKHYNKTCFFDIDDLVIDTKYTNKIPYLSTLSPDEKALYDDGVHRMRRTMELCQYGITTTGALQRELRHYMKEVCINRNVASDEMVYVAHQALKARPIADGNSKVVIGYFSGSITHNDDFAMVLPALERLMKEREDVSLKIAGILDLPETLQPFSDRITAVGFMDWRKMPEEIVTCDITIAPLTDSIFNEAKSENKWVESALVKVPVVASNIGAFQDMIVDQETGLLAEDNEWYDALLELIDNPEKRRSIGEAAYRTVVAHHTTTSDMPEIAMFVREKLARNIAFVLPSTDISGGVNVVLKHADILRRKGWDVTLIDAVDEKTLKRSKKSYHYRQTLPGYNVITRCQTKLLVHFDTMVATLWSTLDIVKKYPEVRHRLYFVQSHETGFHVHGTGKPRFMANATYSDMTGVRYITMSLWCQEWLKDIYRHDAAYAPNGIDLEYYPYRERLFREGEKIKILIEGDSKSEYKNTDEAFRIVEKLDPQKYEISYLSYRKEPKDWYRVDHFYNRIPPEEVGKVYAASDILIKTSILESFSYPPLEMMATGGVSVVVPNGGNREYLKDGENCLFYPQGDIEAGVRAVESLVDDAKLRKKLIKNGRQTAEAYQWDSIEDRVAALYES